MSELKDAKQAAMELDRLAPQQQAVQHRPPDVADMLHAVITKGVTAENVNAVKEIVALYERMEDRKSAKSASQALREMQAEAKAIIANKVVPDKHGGCRYKYAPYEEIMAQAQPLLTKHGFSVRFSQRMDADRLTSVCTLTHDDGHSFTNEFTVRVGSGPPGATTTQADSSAGTTAQREAFCDALNVVRRVDDNAASIGGKITQQQADELERRVAETNSNRAAFFRVAGAESFADIAATKYEILDNLLAEKERGKA